ncbi:uncharacterized protein G2W53_025832 [Senna tora]|uniref:Uncharacterized protein n=1 Tax=Senna tora TaxID=362788 RepID=A0A834TDY8_9FABA|nr:uncharacterized protein G2W53_025832 [Senna tora]
MARAMAEPYEIGNTTTKALL